MTRLFTKTDVERAARLAAQYAANADRCDVEQAIAAAVAFVTDETPLYYSESELVTMFQHVLGKQNVDKEVAYALDALRR